MNWRWQDQSELMRKKLVFLTNPAFKKRAPKLLPWLAVMLFYSCGLEMQCAAPALEISEKSTYGGPTTRYCLKLQNQIKDKWKPLEGYDEKKCANILVDETGKIRQVKQGETAEKFLLDLKPQKNPPIKSGKPFWLLACLCNNTDQISVTLRDIEWGPFMNTLQKSIKQNWYPPKGDETKRVQVAFKINGDGSLTSLKLIKSSGSPAADQSGIKAVEAGAPFEPIPDGGPSDIDVEFTFDFNVLNDRKK